ncbi:MAG: hypothetical protein ABI628_08305 [Chloroflexota bacterium]
MTAQPIALQRRSLNPLSGLTHDPRQRRIVAVLLLAALIYPFLASAGIVPEFVPAPTTNNLIVMCYYAVLALGLNIVVGFAGLLDLGYVAFYVFGAYTTAFLGSEQFGFHLSWWVTVWIAVAVAALAGVLLGAPTLRLRGDYLAIVTLGFGEIVPLLFKNLDKVNINIAGNTIIGPDFNLTGGVLGINPIDPPTLPNPFGKEIIFSNSNPHASLYLILVILVVVFFLCRRLRDSRLGRAWMAIREDETAAEAMGINTVSTKLLAFSLGASCSGFVGAFVSSYQTAVFPESFNFAISITILIMVVLGGMGSLRGAVLGAFALSYVSETFLPWAGTFVNPPINSLGAATDIAFFSNFTLSAYNYLIFGVVLVLMMIFRPEGLLPSATRRAELHGEGIAADSTFGTTASVAEAATDFEETLQAEETATTDDSERTAQTAEGDDGQPPSGPGAGSAP